ncbi:MAG: F0F1 ATP synthase subunit delta [Arsenophonus sp.]
MFEISMLARPYAKAAFDFAVENQVVDKWGNMLSFIAEATSNQQISNQLLSCSIAPETLAKIFITICADEIDEHVRNLIRIMAENGRLSTLPEVFKQFIQLRAFLESTVDINVISATEINKKQKFKISSAMEKRLSCCKVNLNCKIDNSVIAGLIIRAGDLVIDGSVRGRIDRLTNVLQS